MTTQTRYTEVEQDTTMRDLRDLAQRRKAGTLTQEQYNQAYDQINRRHGRRCRRWFCHQRAAVTLRGKALCGEHYLAARTRPRRDIAYWLSCALILLVLAPATALATWLVWILARALGLI